MNAAATWSRAARRDQTRSRVHPVVLVFAALFCAAVATLVARVGPADALPAYARQTGQPCSVCQSLFPELTPFGRRFKIGGYRLDGCTMSPR
jgi:hypothetical protein